LSVKEGGLSLPAGSSASFSIAIAIAD
jgi:hypothetical protein